jgi:hypothetical protein
MDIFIAQSLPDSHLYNIYEKHSASSYDRHSVNQTILHIVKLGNIHALNMYIINIRRLFARYPGSIIMPIVPEHVSIIIRAFKLAVRFNIMNVIKWYNDIVHRIDDTNMLTIDEVNILIEHVNHIHVHIPQKFNNVSTIKFLIDNNLLSIEKYNNTSLNIPTLEVLLYLKSTYPHINFKVDITKCIRHNTELELIKYVISYMHVEKCELEYLYICSIKNGRIDILDYLTTPDSNGNIIFSTNNEMWTVKTLDTWYVHDNMFIKRRLTLGLLKWLNGDRTNCKTRTLLIEPLLSLIMCNIFDNNLVDCCIYMMDHMDLCEYLNQMPNIKIYTDNVEIFKYLYNACPDKIKEITIDTLQKCRYHLAKYILDNVDIQYTQIYGFKYLETVRLIRRYIDQRKTPLTHHNLGILTVNMLQDIPE